MAFIVQFGGGVTSYEALRRAIVKHGRENVVAVCADVGEVRDGMGRVVCGEHEDFWRFLTDVESILEIRIEVTKNPNYADIWDVFFKDRFLGNSQYDPCSERMKRGQLLRWMEARYMPLADTIVLGMDWTEPERVKDYRERIAPWPTWFPLLDDPWVSKRDICHALMAQGITPSQVV